MFKWLLGAALAGIFLLVALFSGYGFYRGYDVVAGLKTVVASLSQKTLHKTSEQLYRADQLKVVHYPTLWRGDLESELLTEASGLAASGLQKDTFFSINDSGNEPALFAIGADGKDLGNWPLVYPSHHDFEDIASFEMDGEHFLLVADTGDNFYWRPQVTLFVIREPNLTEIDRLPLESQWSFQVQYPDGPRDVEAVAVDVASSSVLLISKRRVPAEVFTVPLKPESNSVVAKKIALLKGIPEPSARDLREDPRFGRFQSSPTSFDIKRRHAVVVTYRDAYLFERGRRQDWQDVLGGLPTRVKLPHINGLESGSFSQNADKLFVTGERREGYGRMGFFEVDLKP